MTMETVACVADRARAKVDAVAVKGQTYVPQILDAHRKVLSAEKSGYTQALDAAIVAGKLLLDAKEAIRGQFKWSEWRKEHLSQISQTTASRYMRLAKNEGQLKKPDLSTEEGRKISTAVANLAKDGELSIRKAAALLVKHEPRGRPPSRAEKEDTPKPEVVAKDYLKVFAIDELIIFLREVFDAEYLDRLAKALAPPIERRV